MFIVEEWLKLFEKNVLRNLGKILEPKRDEVTGHRRKLNNDETHYVYY